jgi:hypothetical protein
MRKGKYTKGISARKFGDHCALTRFTDHFASMKKL